MSINFDDLINNPYMSFSKILDFYKIEINKNFLLKSIDLNSKKKLQNIGYSDFKIISSTEQIDLRDQIDIIVKEYFLNKNFDYKKIF